MYLPEEQEIKRIKGRDIKIGLFLYITKAYYLKLLCSLIFLLYVVIRTLCRRSYFLDTDN